MGDAQRTQIRKRTSQRVDAVSATGFAKFLSLLHTISGEGQSVISLGVGEPDYRTPWHICEAAVEAFRQGYTGYTPSAGFPELRRAVAEDMESRYGVAYDPDSEVLITVGSSEAIDLAFRAMLDPGDEVVVPDPYYICYPTCVELTGGVLVPVPTSAESGFKLQALDIEAYITPRTKALLFGYPANPTGTEMHRDELARLARVVEQNDLLVVSDEIYSRLTYGVEHTCFASLGNEGAYHSARWLLKEVRDDGLAPGLRRRSSRPDSGHGQDTPVHHAESAQRHPDGWITGAPSG